MNKRLIILFVVSLLAAVLAVPTYASDGKYDPSPGRSALHPPTITISTPAGVVIDITGAGIVIDHTGAGVVIDHTSAGLKLP